MKKIIPIIICIAFITFAFPVHSQNSSSNDPIKVSGFFDSAHHWKDITDNEQVIARLPEQKDYKPSQIKEIADNILLYQQKNGGWPKNYDMMAILTPGQIEILKEGRDSLHTTFDNGATYSQVEYLARAYTLLKDERYKNASLKGIDFILRAQYPNGGWPQFYPDTSGYRKFITYNDSAMIGILAVLQKIVQNKSYFSFIDKEKRAAVGKAFWDGINCTLNCQIKERGQLTVWGQQHDNISLKPQHARTFELASKCSEESAQLVLMMMKIEHPNKKIVNSIKSAVRWFKDSELKGIRVEVIKAPKIVYRYHETSADRLVVKDPSAHPIWARFYELGTNKPLFCNRDGKAVYSLAEVDRERRTGYTWYEYTPQEVLNEYPEWLKRIGE